MVCVTFLFIPLMQFSLLEEEEEEVGSFIFIFIAIESKKNTLIEEALIGNRGRQNQRLCLENMIDLHFTLSLST